MAPSSSSLATLSEFATGDLALELGDPGVLLGELGLELGGRSVASRTSASGSSAFSSAPT
ncbi:hypothetical protein G6O69_38835 [Pseudenhygromyxa sp. WMMC2535]|uniref:hypothetical protein n=1 Tax=Pseudenhygromyxa sp. WMMC2535 TaxID=2712867 RepID=UPI0015963D14|nr:hypothetical protein [Pseudenhygromyxa sp. WMMC2535]NVB43816.1 hypothetical protein [Pseudenhygromyxa sp. WMMC2535]